MQCTTSLFLVPFVVLVSLTVETIGGKLNAVDNLYGQVSKQVMKQLQSVVDDLHDTFTSANEQLTENNVLLDSMMEYREAYKSSKDTDCAAEKPPSDDDKYLVNSVLSGCDGSLPRDEINGFTNDVEAVKAQVIEIDGHLRDDCTSEPKNCQASEREAEVKLDGVFSPQIKRNFDNEAEKVLIKYQQNLNNCFKKDSANHVKQFKEGAKAMNECLKNL